MVICGLDEAGRGALAGPLVAAAVILNNIRLPLKDGKLLKPRQRERIYRRAKKLGAQIWVEVISTRRINNRGIGRANREALRNLIKRVDADRYVVDGKLKLGRIKDKTHKVETIVDADATIPEAMLAGIVAKVERDRLMRKLHREYPGFGWRRNVGYGTKKHIATLNQIPMTIYHRRSFVTTALRHLHPIVTSVQL